MNSFLARSADTTQVDTALEGKVGFHSSSFKASLSKFVLLFEKPSPSMSSFDQKARLSVFFTDLRLRSISFLVALFFLLFAVNAFGQVNQATVTISTSATSGGAFSGTAPNRTFTPSASTANIQASALVTELLTNNVTIITAFAGGTGTGNVTFNTPVTAATTSATQRTFTITAGGSITVSASSAITLTPATPAATILGRSASNIVFSATTTISIASTITVRGGSGGAGAAGGNAAARTGGNGGDAGSITLTGPSGLNINSDLITTGGTGGNATGGGVNGNAGNAGNLTINGTSGITLTGNLTANAGTAGTGGSGGGGAAGTAGNFTINDGSSSVTSGGGVNDGQTAGIISGGTLTKSGNGTFVMEGANTYTGLTTISAGTLGLNNTAALGTTAAGTSITSGAVLDLNGINYASDEALTVNGTGISSGGAVINSSATGATYAGLLTLGSASSIVGGTGTIDISNVGTITGAGFGLTLGGAQGGTLTSILGTTTGTLTKQDAGTWTLSGASTYTGLTTISAGILKLGNTGVATNTPLGTTGAGTSVTSGAALDLGGFTLVTAEALTLNGTGVSSGGALMNSGAATTYNGAITLASGSTIGGNITVGSGGISGSQPLTVAASSSLNLGSGAVSTTDLVIGSGATLTSTSSTLTVTGNFTNNGTFTHNSGTVTLTGGAQTISGATIFNNLILNGAGIKTLSGANITVNGLMTFTNGYIVPLATEKVIISNTGTVSGANNNSFVKGPVQKIGSNSTANYTFVFPTGQSDNLYDPVEIKFPTATTVDAFTVVHNHAVTVPFSSSKTSSVATVNDKEYWEITKDNLVDNTAGVAVTLHFHVVSGETTNLDAITKANLRIGHYSSTLSKWEVPNILQNTYGGTVTIGGQTAYKYTVTGVTSFSPFATVEASSAALPVTLTSFTAKPTPDNKVSLGWVTSSEQVNKGFRIERQTTAETGKFAQIGFVATKAKDGNSQSMLTYNFIDNAPKTGASSFYRLVQEDLDGKLTYSDIRVVRLNGQSVSMVFPNPSNGVVNISRTADGKKMNIQVIDQSGKIVSQAYNITNANYTMSILQSGFYSVKLMYPETGEQSIQRIVVQR